MTLRLRTRRKCQQATLALFLLAAALAAVLQAAPCGFAQGSVTFPTNEPPHKRKTKPMPDRVPDKPSLPPAYTIAVDPLGFSAPGPIYLGQRNTLASLDFLDENRILFTFRVPGLLHREEGSNSDGDERQIRAVVLSLPSGAVTAEAMWTVHDRVRYLWMLKDGHFLLRDRDGLQTGDAKLELKPQLHFPGPLLTLELDPSQQYLVTNSREPAAVEPKAGDAPSPPSARVNMTVDGEKPGAPDLVVRILRRDSGQVMLVSRTRMPVHLPINSDGYVESLRGNGEQWLLNLNYFSGGTRALGRVNSTCAPGLDFLSQRELVVSGCDGGGSHKLMAMTTDGLHLWDNLSSPQAIWPLLVVSPGGLRLAQETLEVSHAVNAYAPLDTDDVKGQLVRVFDAADGKMELEAQASPPLDAGGNVAISASGRRVAVLHAGTIQVFELPGPPELPNSQSNAPKDQAVR